MVYILKKTKPSKKGLYLQIYISYYDKTSKTKKNRSYQTLGYVSDLVAKGIEDPISYYEKIVKEMNEELKHKQSQTISTNSTMKNVGHFLIKLAFDLLNIDEELNLLLGIDNTNTAEILKKLCYVECVYPNVGINHIAKKTQTLYGDNTISNKEIESTLYIIGTNFNKITNFLSKKIYQQNNFNKSKIYIYYSNDKLSYFINQLFNIDESYLKKQVIIFDENLVPIFVNYYNKEEGKRDVEEFIRKLNCKQVINVFDCDELTFDIKSKVESNYIYHKPINKLDKEEIQKILSKNKNNRWMSVNNTESGINYKYKQFKNTDNSSEKTIVFYSDKLYTIDSKELINAFKCLKEVNDDNLLFNSKDCTNLLGYKVVICSNEKEDPKNIYELYFKVKKLKSYYESLNFLLAQNYNKKYDLIILKGYFIVCYFSVTLIKFLEMNVFNKQINSQQILDFIKESKVTENIDSTFTNNMTKSKVLEIVKDCCNVSKLDNISLSKKNIDSWFNVKINNK